MFINMCLHFQQVLELESETIRKLTEYSDIVEFERLCSDLLAKLGYQGIEPQGIGRKDGGKDALLTHNENQTLGSLCKHDLCLVANLSHPSKL